MLNPENVLALLDEVAAAKARAADLQKHHTLTLAEKLDIWKGAGQAAANRFDAVAQAYRELLTTYQKSAPTPTPNTRHE